MSKDANTLKIVGLLVDVAKSDTVYRDLHLKRARELLSATLDEASYRALGSIATEIDDLTSRSRTAVLHREWAQAAELSAQIESRRQRLATTRNLAVIGKEVYEADSVVFEPFSPGKHLGSQAGQAELQTQLTDSLASLAKLDSAASTFYEKRRSYFAALEVKSEVVTTQKGPQRDRAQVERQAMEAAERGDAAALQRLAKELQDWQESAAGPAAVNAPLALGRYECPVDLSAPFPPPVIERARELGLVEAHTAPMSKLAKVREAIYTHVDQPMPSHPDMEREGILRSRALAELAIPDELDTEETRVLVGQFIQQIFVNSGGARYLPPLTAESVLWEDFAENESVAGQPSKLLAALGMTKRNGCAHAEIESKLMLSGAVIVEKLLGLDPVEFRLVCIPYDLYARFGSERGFGNWPHWTHLDGYQVMAGNRLRALAGGDSRFGGLWDMVSISPSDAHEGIYARFAVVRRARQILRWR